jgi:LmbE family N-acetylglucosaminyl deacetylase
MNRGPETALCKNSSVTERSFGRRAPDRESRGDFWQAHKFMTSPGRQSNLTRTVKRYRLPLGIALALLLLAIGVLHSTRAQSRDGAMPRASTEVRPIQIDRGGAGLWQTLLKLHTRASLLMVVAHPDDEDSGMLALETRGQGARAMMLTLNRGEGGQNVMSDDFGDALGLVRTQELLSADRYSGVQQFFSSVVDFGFSKTREESLALWGHDRVLADAVRVVRATRPLVVTSVFVGGPTDGHGHHQVAGQIAQEVFAAAGDPNMFPDQIREGLRPWSPLKMYARVPTFSVSPQGIRDSATGKLFPVRFYDYIHKDWSDGMPSIDVEIHEGNFDSVLGASYLQVAREGLALQKSQNGGGGIPYAGPVNVPYHRYASQVPASGKEDSFFAGVDVSLAGIATLAQGQANDFLKEGLSRIDGLIVQAMREFSLDHPEKLAPSLAKGLEQTNALVAKVSASQLSDESKYNVLHELAIKQDQFQQAVIESLGFSMQATVVPKKESARPNFFQTGPSETFAYAVPGQDFPVKIHLYNPAASALGIDRVWLQTPNGENWTVKSELPAGRKLAAGEELDDKFEVRIPENAAATRPYFTRPSDEQPYYDILDVRYLTLPLPPYPLTAWVEFSYEGVTVRVGQSVQTVRQLNGPGMELDPLMVTPAVSVRIEPHAGIAALGEQSFALSALVHTEVEIGAKGTVRLELPQGWRSEPAVAAFEMQRAGEEQNISFQVFPNQLEQKTYTVTAVAEFAGRGYREGFTTVGYPGLRSYNLYMPAIYRTSGVDCKIAPGLHVAYITGTGDAVPQSLANIGLRAEFLSPQDLSQGDLQKYDVIVLGVRAYAARPELATHNQRLLDYVKNGGVVIVQYNTGQYDHNYGPYPYSLPNTAERVVDENSHVEFVDPTSPVLTWPNEINQRDFTGWVEERGHGFLSSWDKHYEAPLETHDPEQEPQKGGLVFARYGRGVYVYVALALYRQLPDGVPGAYRLFANLLSLPRNPALKPHDPVAAGSSKK